MYSLQPECPLQLDELGCSLQLESPLQLNAPGNLTASCNLIAPLLLPLLDCAGAGPCHALGR